MRFHLKSISIYLLLFFFILVSCEKKKAKTEISQPFELVKAPDFSADSAYYFVEKQVAFGPRIPNTKAHEACGDFFIKTFKKYKAEVTVQSFIADAYNGEKLNSKNIIASYFPNAKRRIIFASHWDTRPFADQDSTEMNVPIDGANDGASGVGVLLEIARVLGQDTTNSEVGIDLILFDSEDYGHPEFKKKEDFPTMKEHEQYYCLGSQYWSRNMHKPDYSAYYGVLLDMVGAQNATFAKEGTSMKYAGSVVDKIWEFGQKLGYGQYFIDYHSNQIIDDHLYVNTNGRIPMIDIIEFKNSEHYFADYWHTHRDNMKIIDKNTLKAVGQTLLQVIYNEKAGK